MQTADLTWARLCAAAVLLAGVYMLVCIVTRLKLSALANFPGPKIAAVTGLYEFYHDAIRGGQYVWKVAEMHRQYGPVVRISPDELHVSDADFYATLYAANPERRDKVARNARQFGAPDSVLAAVHHDVHRMRRSSLSPFFAKASVYRLEPVIQRKIDQMLQRLQAFRASKQPIPLHAMFTAFTNDVVMEYAFARSDDRMSHPQFDPVFLDAFSAASDLCHVTLHMNWILRLLQSMPVRLAKMVMPGLGKVVDFQDRVRDHIRDIQNGTGEAKAASMHRTIFHEILDSSMPEDEKRLARLWQEGMVIVGAGTETTAWTLVVAVVHIILHDDMRARLQTELRAAAASAPGDFLSLRELEKLPYLSACIKESLRLSYGVTSRLPRVNPKEALHTPSGLVIPPGVKVSMDSVSMHRNEQLFPDPDAFQPDRWLDDHRRDRYLVSFSKGARQCLGINLAMAELYMALATVFGRVEDDGGRRLQLLKGALAKEDVCISGDMFVPAVTSGDKHVQAVYR